MKRNQEKVIWVFIRKHRKNYLNVEFIKNSTDFFLIQTFLNKRTNKQVNKHENQFMNERKYTKMNKTRNKRMNKCKQKDYKKTDQ